MAVYRNLDGTTATSFKIGKGGVTLYQGDAEPVGVNGDFWFDPTSAELKVKISGAWELTRFDNLKLSGNTISSTDTDGNISIVPDGVGNVILGVAGAGTSTMTAPDNTSVVIEAGPGTGAGDGGDLTLKGGTPEGAGAYGNVILGVTGGGASTMTAPDDTDVILAAGPGGTGDNPGADFYIRGGTGIGAGADGDVIIDVGNLSVINNIAATGTLSGSNFSGSSSGTNTGDQTSIVGITGTLAQFNTALTDATFATGGGTVTGTSSGTNTGDEPAASDTIPGIVELATIAETNTGTDTTRAVTPDGLDGWTGSAQITTLGTISSGTWQGSSIDQTYITGLSGTNTGDQTSIVGITGTLAQFNTALTDATFATGGGTVTGTSSGTNTGDEPAASLTVPGIVELATVAETNTGTDATRAVTPDGLDGWTGSAQLTTVGTITSGTWQGSAIDQTYITGLSGTNTGDQTSIVGITGTLAQFNTALTDATFATGGGTATGTNTGDEPAASLTVPGIVELATVAETNTGTDATRAVTPDGLDGWTGSAQLTTVGTISSGTWQGSSIDQTYITGLSGTNTGDQTSIVGITGTLAQFNTALTDATFATGGGTVTGTSSGTNTGDQTSIVGITGTKAQFDTAVTDGNFLYVGDVTSDTGTPAILSNGTTPSLNTGITGDEIRSLIGAGTSSTTGTVTSVSVTTANGVSGSVATSTTTPAITLTLGAITPTSVGGITSANLLDKSATETVSGAWTFSNTSLTHSAATTPTFTVRTSAASSQDAMLEISGARTGSSTANIAALDFQNLDNTTARITMRDPAASNVAGDGELRFQTADNFVLTDALVLGRDNSATFGSYVVTTGVGLNTSPGTDNLRLGGYGVIGSRATMYFTNAGGTVQIGNGTTHNSDPAAQFRTTEIDLLRTTNVLGNLYVEGAAGATAANRYRIHHDNSNVYIDHGGDILWRDQGGTVSMRLWDGSHTLSVTGNVTAANLTQYLPTQAITGTSGTTAGLMTVLDGLGMFDKPSVLKCTWSYAGNDDITDTGIGTIELAGSVIETFPSGATRHVRITCTNTGGSADTTWIYNDQGATYSPGWRKYAEQNSAATFSSLTVDGTVDASSLNTSGGLLSLTQNDSSTTQGSMAVGTNFHIDSRETASAIYLNYYGGTNGVYVGNGSSGLGPLQAGTITTNQLTITNGATFRDVTGNYGSVEIDGAATGGWEGYSIGGRVLFMHNNSTAYGLYNDVVNEWCLYALQDGATDIRYNGAARVTTSNAGASITGTLTATGDVVAYSDIRVKKDLEPIENALIKLKDITGYTFKRIDRDDEVMSGVIAQEIEKVLPQAVFEDEEGMKAVSANQVQALIIQAINELVVEVTAIKEKI